MKSRSRAYTVIVQRDGALGSHTVRLPLWTFRLGLLAGGPWSRAWCFIAVLYGPILRAAARVPGLERDVTRLRAENAKIVSSVRRSTAWRSATPKCAR